VQLAGDGPERTALQRLASELGVASHTQFLGQVPRTELPTLYRSAGAFCHPARSDNFPTAVIEAMACGRAVLVSDTGALPEMVADSGLIHRAGDSIGLARQIVEVVSNEGVRRDLGLAGRARAVANYSQETMSSRYLHLYNRLEKYRRSVPEPA
jgi:glycosyltransferase involved in cell wall biosynthesis